MSDLPINIDDLLNARGVESARRELKATWNEYIADSALHTICAFANDFYNLNGGYIIVGVEEHDGRPVLPPRGLAPEDLDGIQKEIRGACNRLDPAYQPLLSPELVGDRHVLVIWVPAGDNKPYQAPAGRKDPTRHHYVRTGSESVKAEGDIRRQLLEQAAKVPFDARRNHESRIEDISPTLVRRFLRNVNSRLLPDEGTADDRELYRKMRIVARTNGHEVPLNVALLFFHESPDAFFPGAKIEVAQYSDEGGTVFSERTFRGPLDGQVREVLEHLDGLAGVRTRKIEGRAEVGRVVAFPYGAMEEALVNAVYHRSYATDCVEPIKVHLHPDRMEIISYPGPVPGLHPAHFAAGSSVPQVPARNRRIGEFLKELRLAEARGSGIPTLRRRMTENGSPEPRFEFDDETRTYFKVVLPAHPGHAALLALGGATELWLLGDRSAALARLEDAFQRHPSSGEIASELITRAAATDRMELAERTFAAFRGRSDQSKPSLPFLAIAKAYGERQRPEDARRVLAEVPADVDAEGEVLLDAAVLRRQLGDFQAAHALFDRAARLLPDNPKVIHELAQTKMRLTADLRRPRDAVVRDKLNREAAELLRRAIRLATDPIRSAWCWSDLAKVSEWLHEPDAGIDAAYRKARELVPDEPKFRSWHEAWQLRQGRRRR